VRSSVSIPPDQFLDPTPGGSVQTVTLGGRKLEPAKEYIASVKDEAALVLFWTDIRGDIPVSLAGK
jgi:hypothetical protein